MNEEDESKRSPLAYQNEPFLRSPDGRILRILSEYAEPLSRFRREQIQDTVVFFGSARFHSRSLAEIDLAKCDSPEGSDLSTGNAQRQRWTWRVTTKTRGGWRFC